MAPFVKAGFICTSGADIIHKQGSISFPRSTFRIRSDDGDACRKQLKGWPLRRIRVPGGNHQMIKLIRAEISSNMIINSSLKEKDSNAASGCGNRRPLSSCATTSSLRKLAYGSFPSVYISCNTILKARIIKIIYSTQISDENNNN
jgi:hypothetical protein